MNKEKIGAFILENRKALGLTQEELAQKLFVTNKAVSKWEKGQSFPDIAMFEPLAKALEVTVSELIAGEKAATPEITVKKLAKEVIDKETKKDILAAIHWTVPVLIFIIGFAVCWWVQKPDIDYMESNLALAERHLAGNFNYFVENTDPEKFTLEDWKTAYEEISATREGTDALFHISGTVTFGYGRYSETYLRDDLELLQDEIFTIIQAGEATPEQKELYRTFTENVTETLNGFECFNVYNE